MEEYHIIVPESSETKLLTHIPLDRISAMVSPMTTGSAMLFRGNLDFPRFKRAIQRSFVQCPWMLGALAGDYNNPSVVPRTVDEHTPSVSEAANSADITDPSLPHGFVVVEYAQHGSDNYDASRSIAEYLPKRVHQKMVRVDLAMASIDGLPVSALRVTQYADKHFVIGYRLNHAFYDQSAIVSYFHFLSFLYLHGDLPVPPELPLPTYKPRVHIVPAGATFQSDEDFLAAAPKGYTTEPAGAMTFGIPLAATLTFDSAKIEEVKKEAGDGANISSNDILHAILLKTFARHAASTSEEEDPAIRLFFARNMRHPLHVGPETIGDYVRVQLFPSTSKKATAASIAELAKENRAALSATSSEALREVYSKECQWFVQYPLHRSANNGLPFVDFIMDQNAVIVTNWTSFPYEKVLFGDEKSAPVELLLEGAPYMTGTGAMVRVSFKIVNGERQLVAVLNSRYQPIIDQIKQLAEETGLFSCSV